MGDSNPTNINIGGNVQGNIVVGDNNFVVNENHGTVVYQAAAPQVKRRAVSPKPPRKPRNFIGRTDELARLDEWISSTTPVLIQGVDGLGKSSLGKQASNGKIAVSQPDGVLFLEGIDHVGELLGLDDVTQTLFDALFESDSRLKVDLTTARTYLSNTQPLVYLNQIILSSSDLSRLLDLFPNAPIMISSDTPLRCDDYESMSLPLLSKEESITLLVERTKQNELELFTQIAQVLNNFPAALVTVVNVIGEGRLSAAEALERLKSYKSTTKDKNSAALESSFAVLLSVVSDDEREMLLQTAAAPGISIDRAWLESVCGGKKVSESLEALQVLQANSPRLRLMPGFRERLARESDLNKYRLRLLDHLIGELKNRSKDFGFIKDELGNLLGLLGWAITQGNWLAVKSLGSALDPYLTLNGLWSSWSSVLQHLKSAAIESKDLALEAKVLHQLGTREFGLGNKSAAKELLEQALSIREKLGDVQGVAFTKHNLDAVISGVVPEMPKIQKPLRAAPFVVTGISILLIAAALIIFKPWPEASSVPLPDETKRSTETFSTELSSESSTLTPTVTETETPIPPTETMTLTPSKTSTPSITPTYSILTGKVNVGRANCRYGPGGAYITTGFALNSFYKLTVVGRDVTSRWLYINYENFEGGLTYCWVQADLVDLLDGDVVGLENYYPGKYEIPFWRDYLPPMLDFITRSPAGNEVNIVWKDTNNLALGDRQNNNSPLFIIEAWVCNNGELEFTVLGTLGTSMIIKDEPGCVNPSSGLLYSAGVHGYSTPVKLPWPAPP